MLLNHAYSRASRLPNRARGCDLSEQTHLTRIEGRQTIRDAHEGGLARAIFSQERVNRSLGNGKIHSIERDELSKTFRDGTQFERRGATNAIARNHNPVGTSTKTEEMLKRCSRNLASARTPSVSVA